jgi:DNA-binding LacI/PurR family transcriptional regulator
VGRGIFVGSGIAPASAQRNVLVLSREQRTDRGDVIASSLHRELLKRGWRSAVLTYSDFAQATELVRNAPRFDASVVHPRLETMPLALLAALRARSRAVVVEGYATEGIDVDGVAVDWPAAVALGLRHLMELGHHEIGLVTIDRPTRAFTSVIRQFRTLHSWSGLGRGVDPVVLLPSVPEAELYPALAFAMQVHSAQQRKASFSALLVYVGPYHGDRLLLRSTQIASRQSVSPVML